MLLYIYMVDRHTEWVEIHINTEEKKKRKKKESKSISSSKIANSPPCRKQPYPQTHDHKMCVYDVVSRQ